MSSQEEDSQSGGGWCPELATWGQSGGRGAGGEEGQEQELAAQGQGGTRSRASGAGSQGEQKLAVLRPQTQGPTNSNPTQGSSMINYHFDDP